MEVVLGSIEDLKIVMDQQVQLTESEKAMVVAHYKLEIDVEKFEESNITKVKDQVLAWKTINYLHLSRGLFPRSKCSSYRTTWKKKCAPHLVRKTASTKVKTENEFNIKEEIPDEEEYKNQVINVDEDDLFNTDVIYRKQLDIINNLKNEKRRLEGSLEKLETKLNIINAKLNHYEGVLHSYYGYPPTEHQVAGGVDQGEREGDEEEQYEG